MRKHHIAAVAAAAVLAAASIPALTARASTSPNHLWMKQDISQGRESEEQIYVRKPKSPDKVTLSFAGDISFAEGYANMVYYHSNGDDITRCIAPEVIARMDAADIMMINNEFTYSTREFLFPERPLPSGQSRRQRPTCPYCPRTLCPWQTIMSTITERQRF